MWNFTGLYFNRRSLILMKIWLVCDVQQAYMHAHGLYWPITCTICIYTCAVQWLHYMLAIWFWYTLHTSGWCPLYILWKCIVSMIYLGGMLLLYTRYILLYKCLVYIILSVMLSALASQFALPLDFWDLLTLYCAWTCVQEWPLYIFSSFAESVCFSKTSIQFEIRH